MVSIIAISLGAAVGYAQVPNSGGVRPLEQQLSAITTKDKGEGTDISSLENDCLELIKTFNTSADRGIIYGGLALMYSGKGYISPQDLRIAKTVEYCRKALEYPLSPVMAAEIYSRLAGARMASVRSRPQEEIVKASKEAIVSCLSGLKLVLDSHAPKERPIAPLAVVYNYDGDINDPDFQKAIQDVQKKQEQQRVARQEWEIDYKLYILRRSLMVQCADLYLRLSFNTEEVKTSARDILKDHQEAIEEVLTLLDERWTASVKVKDPARNN